MAGTAAKIIITERQQKLLEEFSKSRTVGKCVAQRATIILLGFAGTVERRNRPPSRPQPDASGNLASALAGCVGLLVRVGMYRTPPAA